MDHTAASTQSVSFYNFLDRMRNPASLDLVRSIKSFIVSFSFYTANPENDGKRVQEFYSTMEAAIADHPLWVGATGEEIDSAMEGLEKYVMTKLFPRTFASTPEDVKCDCEISEKICLLQTFLRPEHLDIPPVLQNEASWLLAEKELQKINTFKAPREKLLCIMNCCRVINNLLLNVSMSENHVLAGADDFLPVLIYVTIKANPPQLHSNLKFIQLYRRQTVLVSESAYYFTNLISAKTFILDLNAKSLSIDETKFEESMKAAKLAKKASQPESSLEPYYTTASAELRGLSPVAVLNNDETSTSGGSSYPYMNAEPGELTVGDVEGLLSVYKDVVMKYTNLCKAVRHVSINKKVLPGRSSDRTDVSSTPPAETNIYLEKEKEEIREQHQWELKDSQG